MSNLVKPTEYAESQGISRQAVYAKIKKGTLTSKTINGRIYVVLETDLVPRVVKQQTSEVSGEESLSPFVNFKELLNSKDQTITVLQESISDLKQTNTEINTTLRGEIELLKQVFSEMRNLYVKQVDYMSSEKHLELENRQPEEEENSVGVEEILEEKEEECWITIEEFFERSKIKKNKKRLKIEKRLSKAYKNGDKRLKKNKKILYISCYYFYEDIIKK